LDELTLAAAAALIRRREISPRELLDAYLDRIRRFDGIYMAFNTVLEEEARARADRLGRELDMERGDGREPGALKGIPLAIKDNFYTAGVLTTANSHIYADFVPDYDATSWARLKAAGAILLGKTQMGPLATTAATTPDGDRTTMNAWAPTNPDVSPSGSSSGSATAVAARMAACSTGTQTGGSITGPAGAQGLTGLKPTMGRVSLRGIIPLTYTRDHPGPIARDALDAALMLQVMAGPDPGDPRTLGQPEVPDFVEAAVAVEQAGRPSLRWPTTIGVIPGYLDEPPEPSEQEVSDFGRLMTPEQRRARYLRAVDESRARREMLNSFRELGAQVVEVELPRDWETLTSSEFNNVRLPERAEPFLAHLREDVRKFGVSLSPWINGLLLSGTEYLRGQRAKLLLLEQVLGDLFSQCDVVVQTQPFPFDMIGLPLISFPMGFEEVSAGTPLPMGAMLGGQPWAEDRLLSLAAGYQAVTDWHRRRPEDPEPEASAPGGETGGHGGAGRMGMPGHASGGGWGVPLDLGREGRFGRGRIDVSDVMESGE
jgi:Asp-tRNA(Asn)/Glu-tRNA(Gln) amidotransferase A subunit family amidase